MKKIWLLILIPSLSFGAVTQAQVDQAAASNQQMFDCYAAMRRYINGVDFILNNTTFTVPGSTLTVTIPQATINQMIDLARYQASKACYVNAFGTFP